MSTENAVMCGVVKDYTPLGELVQGLREYTVEVTLPTGGIAVYQRVRAWMRMWPADQLVTFWPVGTAVPIAVIGQVVVGMFPEPPAVGPCPPAGEGA